MLLMVVVMVVMVPMVMAGAVGIVAGFPVSVRGMAVVMAAAGWLLCAVAVAGTVASIVFHHVPLPSSAKTLSQTAVAMPSAAET